MCLLIIELLLLCAGIVALVSGKLPAGLFRVLFGKGEYALPANRARWYGLLLASPLPVALLAGLFLGVFLGDSATSLAQAFELTYLIVVCIASILIARRIRRPSPAPPSAPASGAV